VALAYSENEGVLARQAQGEYWYPAIFVAEEGEEVTVQYVAGMSQETLPKDMVKPLKFKAKGRIECDTNADGSYEPGELTDKSKKDKMVVKFKNGEKAVDFLSKCRLPQDHDAEAAPADAAAPTCKNAGAPANRSDKVHKEKGKAYPLFACEAKADVVLCPSGKRGLIRKKAGQKLFMCPDIVHDPSCPTGNCLAGAAAADQDCIELPYATNVPLCSAGNAANVARVDDQGRTLWYCTNAEHTPRCPNNGCKGQEGGILNEANPDRKVYFCDGVSAPKQEQAAEVSNAASANGKFKKLVGEFECPEACEYLGSSKCNGQPDDFYMENGGNKSSGSVYCGAEAGSVSAEGHNYWVYAKPKWYVWLCRSDADPAYNPECE
jgi:hypothetical protein